MNTSSMKIRDSFNYEVNHRVRVRIINMFLIVAGAIGYFSIL